MNKHELSQDPEGKQKDLENYAENYLGVPNFQPGIVNNNYSMPSPGSQPQGNYGQMNMHRPTPHSPIVQGNEMNGNMYNPNMMMRQGQEPVNYQPPPQMYQQPMYSSNPNPQNQGISYHQPQPQPQPTPQQPPYTNNFQNQPQKMIQTTVMAPNYGALTPNPTSGSPQNTNPQGVPPPQQPPQGVPNPIPNGIPSTRRSISQPGMPTEVILTDIGTRLKLNGSLEDGLFFELKLIFPIFFNFLNY